MRRPSAWCRSSAREWLAGGRSRGVSIVTSRWLKSTASRRKGIALGGCCGALGRSAIRATLMRGMRGRKACSTAKLSKMDSSRRGTATASPPENFRCSRSDAPSSTRLAFCKGRAPSRPARAAIPASTRTREGSVDGAGRRNVGSAFHYLISPWLRSAASNSLPQNCFAI